MAATIFIFPTLTIMFVIIGVLIKYFKCYWLISGYNTASDEKKEKIDIVGLGNLMGNFCFFLGGMFLILGILNYFKISSGTILVFPIICASIIYLIIKAQRFDRNPNSSKISKIIALFIGAFFIIIFGVILYSARETEVIITKQAIEIKGVYGEKLEMSEIDEITLKDSMPKVKGKVNGFDFGKTLKGNFNLDKLGTNKIYVYYGQPPYIHIKHGDDYIILNHRSRDRTIKLYEDMIKQWKN
jgi:hypothetical protein